jgi:hypothetical protein
MQLSLPPKPKATRKRLKKEILSDDPASLYRLCTILGKSQNENSLYLTYFKIIHLIRSLKIQISSAQYNTMHTLLYGKYIRLSVKNIISILFLQTILKDKPLT